MSAASRSKFYPGGLLMLALLWFISAPPAVAQAGGCDTSWANETGYSIICDTFPDEAVCWPEWELEEHCWQWCWQIGEATEAQDWGCSLEGYYQMEIYCGCVDPY